jgi:hypothetical protein
MIFFLILTSGANAQENNSVVELEKLFELSITSIERKMTVSKRGVDTSYYLNYTIKNISNDTLTYITNTCFYYNHSLLKVGNLEIDLNMPGGCSGNMLNLYTLAPDSSFTESQWITAHNLNKLNNGEWNTTLSVRLIKDDQEVYRVDGRYCVENGEYLVFNGKTKIIETIIDNRKRQKKKKHRTVAEGGWNIGYVEVDSINESHKEMPLKLDFKTPIYKVTKSKLSIRSKITNQDTAYILIRNFKTIVYEKRYISVDKGFFQDQFLEIENYKKDISKRIEETVILEIEKSRIRFKVTIKDYIIKNDKIYKELESVTQEVLWIEKKKLDGVIINN